jgi:hypothetical protein
MLHDDPIVINVRFAAYCCSVLRTLLRALLFERPLVYGLQPKAQYSFSGVNGMQSRRPGGPCR